MGKSKILFYFSILLFVLATAQLVYGLYNKATFMDYYAYYGAGEVFRGGLSPYPLVYNSPTGNLLFIYPPGSLLYLFGPISILPFNYSLILLLLASYIFFVVAIFLTFELLDKKVPLYYKFIITALLVQTLPLKFCLASGQINIFVLFFAVLSLYLLKHKKEGFSALSMAIATTFKLFPLVLIPLYLLKKKFRWVFLFSFFLLVINIFDPVLLKEYVEKIAVFLFAPAQATVNISNPWNQSISKLFKTIFGEVSIPYFAYIIGGILYLLIVFTKRSEKLVKKSVVLLSLASILFKISWQHYLILNYPFIILYYRKLKYFIPIWVILIISFNYGDKLLTSYPLISSYQVILILILLGKYLYDRK